MSMIEDKELRGITGKLLLAIIVQTAIVVATATGFYFTIKSDISNINIVRDEQNKYWQLKFDQLGLQNNAFQKQLDAIQIQLDMLHNDGEKNKR